jgi:hypothetical protein
MAIIVCVFTLLFLELCVWAGQIPSNTYDLKLFKKAEQKLQITDEDGRSVFLSDGAMPLDPELWKMLSGGSGPALKDENTLLFKNRLYGGYAVWEEDITAINRLRAALEETNTSLSLSNDSLAKIAAARDQAAQARARSEFFDAMDGDIAAHEYRLDEMLSHRPYDVGVRASLMGTAAVLVCYIKRRCQFLISEMNGSKTIGMSDVAIYLEELSEIAREAGINCLISCSMEGSLDIRRALLFYDFYNSVLEWSIVYMRGKIVVQLVSEKGRETMKLLASVEGRGYEPPERLWAEACTAGGLIEKEDLGDMAGILLSFPESGIQND